AGGAVRGAAVLLASAGASCAVGFPFVNKWYPPSRQGFALGIYGIGMGGTVLGALTAPRIADAPRVAAPFWIAAFVVAIMAAVFWSIARDAPGAVQGKTGSMLAALAAVRGRGRRRAPGVDALSLTRVSRVC